MSWIIKSKIFNNNKNISWNLRIKKETLSMKMSIKMVTMMNSLLKMNIICNLINNNRRRFKKKISIRLITLIIISSNIYRNYKNKMPILKNLIISN